MTDRSRIAWNVIATYGRSVCSMVAGIFTARWVLKALGTVDYGLYGVVGALTVFIAFFNGALGASVARYYAYSVGRTKMPGNELSGMEECRKWFSVALELYIVIPTAFLLIGYPIGAWAIRDFLTIPTCRIDDCIVVFRFVCAGCFISMMSVPFSAMFSAKQWIVELTIYNFITVIIMFVVSWWMAVHEGDWLVSYAAMMFIASSFPQLLIVIRGVVAHSECRLRIRYLRSMKDVLELLQFTAWNLFAGIGFLFRNQGIAILVNKYYGPKVNAAMTVANSVNGHASSLSTALMTAFTPAITSACGAGQDEQMQRMAYRASKFGVILAMIFLIPLSLELEPIMKLWLVNPPQYASGLCLCMMVMLIADKATIGQCVVVQATGVIKIYQLLFGGCLLMTLPLAWILIFVGGNVYFVGISMIVMMIVAGLVRVIMAKKLGNMGIKKWAVDISRVFSVAILSMLLAWLVQHFFTPSFCRIVVTTIISDVVFFIGLFVCCLDKEEKQVLFAKFHCLRSRFI